MGLVDQVYQEQSNTNNSLVDSVLNKTITEKKRPSGAGRSFAPSLVDKTIEFLTAGHIPAVPYQSEELTPEGKLSKMFPEEGGKVGFFEDPTTMLSFGGVAGARAAKPLVGKLLTAGRETLGWLTGGASEIPSLSVKGAKGLAKSIEVKNLEKLGAKRAGKPFAETALKYIPEENSLVEQVFKTGGEITPRAISTNKYIPEIKDLREQVNIGEPGRRTLTTTGEPIVTQSTYPSWMQDKGWTKNEVLNAIDKGLAGDKLGVRQQEIFNIVKNEARNQFAEQVKIAQKNAIQPIKTGDLEVGDRIRVKGETLKVTEKTDEAITIKDGQEFKLDPYFDTIEGKRVTPAKSEPQLGAKAKQPWEMTREELDYEYTKLKGETSESIQSKIDTIDPNGELSDSPRVKELYRQRDIIDNKQLIEARDSIKSNIDKLISDEEANYILDNIYSLKTGSPTSVYFASEYTQKAVKDTKGTGEKIIRYLTEKYGKDNNLNMDSVLDPNISGWSKKQIDSFKLSITKKAKSITDSIDSYFTKPRPEVLKDYPDLVKGQAKPEVIKSETGLSKLVDEQKQTNQAGKIIIDLGKRDTKPIYSFPSENEFPYQSAKGIKPESVIQRLKNIAVEAGHKFSRDYEHLSNTGENAQLIFDLKRLEKQKDVVADRTTRNIGEVLSGLNKEDYNLFNRKIILDDLASDVNRGLYKGDKKLPFNFTPESLIQEKSKLDALISTNPKVIEALGKRDAFWEQQIKPEYIEALSPYKIGVEDMFKENYYRHQVLDYVSENGIFGTGKRLKTPNKGYMKGRTGASNLYNTDFIEAEHNIMAQMLHDAETAKTLTRIKNTEDISQMVRNQAKIEGIDNWHDAIPEGYVVWQPKEGSVFHPVLTIEERTAQKILEGNIDSILGDEGKLFKEALAVGGKRKEWVVRQEVADTLNNLVRERSKGIISSADLGIITAWKKWQLVSPRRFFKYNMRNLTGDAEAVFLGNMSGFKKVPQAVQELSQTFFGKKPMTSDMANWFERGGMSSTLQAQEMDTLKGMWMFSRLHEKPDLNIWNKYWKNARLTTDFRESILRYANFLDFKEQLIKNGGKPLNYGASKPEMIDGLKDVNDKAYWLSNDLLGAYDRVSVAGQTLRERVMPFWSWQEVNFKRYIQLMKNTSNNTELAAKIGFKLGATGIRAAVKIGSFAIKAAAFSSALAVFNHTVFPEEEKALGTDMRATPHIILGRDKQGNIQYFSRMGTLDDFISWFGLDTAPKLITEYLNGKKTLKEMLKDQAKEAYKGPVNKIAQGGEPFLKLTAELFSRRSFFPDIFKVGTIRDKWLHLARSFGLENEYIAMAGKPSKGYGKSVKNLFVYSIDPGESAYRQAFDLKADFMKKQGKTMEGFWLTPAGDALYNMKLAVKYEDKKAFTKYFTDYIYLAQQQGRTLQQTKQGLRTSILSMNPLYNMDNETKIAFVKSLNKEEQDVLGNAIDFYNDVLSRDVSNKNEEGD